MDDIRKLKAQSRETAERVWKLTGESNENKDLYKGAELELVNEGMVTRVFIKDSGRELTNIRLDKTVPQGNYNLFKIIEVREVGNSIDSIKVLACDIDESNIPAASSSDNSKYWAIGATAFLLGLTGFLAYRWMNER